MKGDIYQFYQGQYIDLSRILEIGAIESKYVDGTCYTFSITFMFLDKPKAYFVYKEFQEQRVNDDIFSVNMGYPVDYISKSGLEGWQVAEKWNEDNVLPEFQKGHESLVKAWLDFKSK